MRLWLGSHVAWLACETLLITRLQYPNASVSQMPDRRELATTKSPLIQEIVRTSYKLFWSYRSRRTSFKFLPVLRIQYCVSTCIEWKGFIGGCGSTRLCTRGGAKADTLPIQNQPCLCPELPLYPSTLLQAQMIPAGETQWCNNPVSYRSLKTCKKSTFKRHKCSSGCRFFLTCFRNTDPPLRVPEIQASKYMLKIQASRYRLRDTGFEIQASKHGLRNRDCFYVFFETQASKYRLEYAGSKTQARIYRLQNTGSKYTGLGCNL